MRLMEMGFVPGQHLSIEPKRLGLHIVHMVAANGRVEQTIVLRSDELGKICLKETI
jgi:Fe2+ transport system protein FeoA